jgi:hypothetical protein
MGIGTTAVVDSSEDVVALALSVPLVIADSAEPDLVDDAEESEVPVVGADSAVVDASDAPGVAVDASVAPEVVVSASEAAEVVVVAPEAPEVVVDASEAPEVVVYASEAPDVADALDSAEVPVAVPVDKDSAPEVASPEPMVSVAVSSAGVEIGTGTMGTVVLLASVADSVELLEETLVGLSVGASVDCSTAVAGTLSVDDASVAVAEVKLPVPTELSVALVVTGTGMAVVPSVPVDVLRL